MLSSRQLPSHTCLPDAKVSLFGLKGTHKQPRTCQPPKAQNRVLALSSHVPLLAPKNGPFRAPSRPRGSKIFARGPPEFPHESRPQPGAAGGPNEAHEGYMDWVSSAAASGRSEKLRRINNPSTAPAQSVTNVGTNCASAAPQIASPCVCECSPRWVPRPRIWAQCFSFGVRSVGAGGARRPAATRASGRLFPVTCR